MAKQDEIEWATIGKVVAPFGVHGELKVLLLTDIPNRFTELKAVHLGPAHTRHLIKAVRPYKGEMVVLKLKGIEDANTAETLRNFDLTIPLDQLAKLPPDSYYQHDILGLQVYTLHGHKIGTIEDIMVTGSNDVYIIKTPDGKQILVPAIKDVVKQIDLIRKMMYIEPISGLLDIDETVDFPEEE
ncbi:MAG TPA: ribosome maturation factor RimM [Ktedonobacteraceae bacterium]|nr:ribosome maturation factor RimM [Ktedonobacteraceae bacterium]